MAIEYFTVPEACEVQLHYKDKIETYPCVIYAGGDIAKIIMNEHTKDEKIVTDLQELHDMGVSKIVLRNDYLIDVEEELIYQ